MDSSLGVFTRTASVGVAGSVPVTTARVSKEATGEVSAPSVRIFGVPVHQVTRREVAERCREWLRGRRPHHIVTVNPEMLLRARRDAWFRTVIADADLVTADGIGVRWATSFLRTADNLASTRLAVLIWFIRTLGAFFLKPQTIPSPIPERVSGSDLLWDIAREARDAGVGVYCVGGARQTALRAAARLQQALPSLKVSSFSSDHIATPYPPYELHVDLMRVAPAVVFVGYGAPQQEEWIHQNLHRFPSIRIAIGVGGALDFLAGNAPRAPFRYQAHGLEWFWRFEHQPSRFLRVLRATMLFPVILLVTRLRHDNAMMANSSH